MVKKCLTDMYASKMGVTVCTNPVCIASFGIIGHTCIGDYGNRVGSLRMHDGRDDSNSMNASSSYLRTV